MKFSEKNNRLRFMSGLLAIFVTAYFMADLFGGGFADSGAAPPVEEMIETVAVPESENGGGTDETAGAPENENGGGTDETAGAPENEETTIVPGETENPEETEIPEETENPEEIEEEPAEEETDEEENTEDEIDPLSDEESPFECDLTADDSPFELTGCTLTYGGRTYQSGETIDFYDYANKGVLDFSIKMTMKSKNATDNYAEYTLKYDLSAASSGVSFPDTEQISLAGTSDASYQIADNMLYIYVGKATNVSAYDGGFSFSGSVEVEKLGLDEEKKAEFNLGKYLWYIRDMAKLPQLSISKKAVGDLTPTGNGSFYQEFEITVSNYSDAPATGVVVEDSYGLLFGKFDDGHNCMARDAQGNAVTHEHSGGNTTTFEIGDLPAKSEKKIVYRLYVDETKDLLVPDSERTNHATATAKEGVSVETQAKAVYRDPKVEKTGVLENGSIVWTVKVDDGFFEDMGLGDDQKDFYITDTVSGTGFADAGELNASKGSFSAVSTGFSATFTKNDFAANGDGTYTLTYTTAAPSVSIGETKKVSNSVSLKYTINEDRAFAGSAEVTVGQGDAYVSKSCGTVAENNDGTYTIPWTVEFHIPDNPNIGSFYLWDDWGANSPLIVPLSDGGTRSTGGTIRQLILSCEGETWTMPVSTPDSTGGYYDKRNLSYTGSAGNELIIDNIWYNDLYSTDQFGISITGDAAKRFVGKTLTISYDLTVSDSVTKVDNTADLTFWGVVEGAKGSASCSRSIVGLKTLSLSQGADELYMHEWRVSAVNSGSAFQEGDKITITDTLPVGYVLDPTPFRFFISEEGNDWGTLGEAVAPSCRVISASTDDRTNRLTFVAEITLDKDTADKFTAGKRLGTVYRTRMGVEYYDQVMADAGKSAGGISLTLENNAVIEAGTATAKTDATSQITVTVPQDLFDKSIVSQSQNPGKGSLTADYRITVNRKYEDLNEDNGEGEINKAQSFVTVTDQLGTKLKFKSGSVVIQAYQEGTYQKIDLPGDGYEIHGDTITFTLHDDVYYTLSYTVESDELLYEQDLTDPAYAEQMQEEIKNRYGNTANLQTLSSTSGTAVKVLNDSTYRLDAFLNYKLTISGTKDWLNDTEAGKNSEFVLIVTQIEKYLKSVADVIGPSEKRTRSYYHFSKNAPTKTEEVIGGETHYYRQCDDANTSVWSYSIPGLTVTDTKGSTYSYLVEEQLIAGYTPSYRYLVDENGVKADTSNSNYEINGTATEARVEISNLSTNRYARPGTIYLHKYDSTDGTKTQLGGATFRLERTDGTGTLNEFTAAGQPNVKVQNARDVQYGETALTFTTIDAADGTAVGNDGTATPYVKIQGIPFGTYQITEISAPVGYTAPDANNGFTFQVQQTGNTISVDSVSGAGNSASYRFDSDSGELSVENTPSDPVDPTGTVTLKKTDEKGNPLSGAEFRLETTSGAELSGVTVGGTSLANDGIFAVPDTGAAIAGLPVGSYTLTETKAPTGYVKASGSVSFTVEADGTVTGDVENGAVTVKNQPVTAGITLKKTDEKGNVLSGAEFRLETTSGAELSGVTVGGTALANSGIFAVPDTGAAIAGLPVGSYTLTETKAPTGYVKASGSVSFTVEADGTVTGDVENGAVTVKNQPVTAEVTIVKNGANANGTTTENLSGAEFVLSGEKAVDWSEVTLNGENGDEVSASYTFTTTDGAFEIAGLPVGKYTLTETAAPSGYGKTDELKFEVGTDGTVISDDSRLTAAHTFTLTDEQLTGEIGIRKVDESNKALSGAKLKLTTTDGSFAKAEVKWANTIPSESDGGSLVLFTAGETARVTGLAPGTYTLTETDAPAKYRKISEAFTFTVAADGTVSAGANAGVTAITLGANGTITVKNTPVTAAIALRKIDESGDPLSGAVFALSGENTVRWSGVSVTDGAGRTVALTEATGDHIAFSSTGNETIAGLPVGKYTLTEMTAPEHYLADHPWNFEVGADGTVVSSDPDDSRFVSAQNTVTFTDKKITEGTIAVTKRGEQGNFLPGAVFAVEKTGGGFDFTAATVAGTDTVTRSADRITFTTENKQVTIAGLPEGTYTITETAAPRGYIGRADAKETVTLTKSADGGSVSYESVAITNERTRVSVNKVDMTGSEQLAGARLTIAPVNGTLAGAPISVADENGEIAFTKTDDELTFKTTGTTATIAGLPAGDYLLTETAAPNGYTVTTDFYFTIGGDGTVAETASRDNKENELNQKTITLKDALTELSIDKVEMTDGKKQLAGAELTIRPVNGTLAGAPISVADEDGAIAFTETGGALTFTTTEKTAKITGLPAGDYVLTETAAPRDYAVTTDFYFTVGADGTVTETAGSDNKGNTLDGTAKTITLKDAPLLSVTIRKTDTAGKALSGAKFTLSSDTVSDWSNVRIGTNALANGEEFEVPENGAAIKGLLAGKYVLTETEAPAGYKKCDTSYRFALGREDGVLSDTTVQAVGEFTPSGNTITVTNQKEQNAGSTDEGDKDPSKDKEDTTTSTTTPTPTPAGGNQGGGSEESGSPETGNPDVTSAPSGGNQSGGSEESGSPETENPDVTSAPAGGNQSGGSEEHSSPETENPDVTSAPAGGNQSGGSEENSSPETENPDVTSAPAGGNQDGGSGATDPTRPGGNSSPGGTGPSNPTGSRPANGTRPTGTSAGTGASANLSEPSGGGAFTEPGGAQPEESAARTTAPENTTAPTAAVSGATAIKPDEIEPERSADRTAGTTVPPQPPKEKAAEKDSAGKTGGESGAGTRSDDPTAVDLDSDSYTNDIPGSRIDSDSVSIEEEENPNTGVPFSSLTAVFAAGLFAALTRRRKKK